MANFDEFDAQSQALLTSLQQNNKFLSFQDLNKGFPDTETFNSSSYKTFDEISQQRSLSSPLGQNSIFSKPQREIFENLITYPQTKKIWRYKVISDVNATQLIKEFREDNSNIKNSRGPYDDELDFIIYAEQNDGSISLGRVLLFKVSDAMVKEYPNNEIPEDFAKKIHEQQQNNPNFKYTVSEIHEAFINSIKLQAHQVSDISILDVENIIKKISTTLSIFFHEDLKFSREQWDPTLKSDKYLFDTPQKAINYIINKCNDSIKELKQLKEKLLVIQSFSISGFEFNTPYVESIIKAIDSQIESINKFKTWLLENKNEIQTDIPYLCGIWNGFIEFIAGIVDVILLALNIILSEVLEDSLNLDLLEIREGVEEIIEKLVDAIKKDPSTIINGIINSIKQYKYSRYDDPSLNKYQLQYNEGEDTILAIDIIATIVVIVKGIAKLGKLLPKFSKWIDDVLKKRKTKKTAINFKRLENAWKSGWNKEKVLEKIKGSRPNPKEYLKAKYIKEHIELFEKEGIVSRIVSKEDFEEYGIGKPDLGKTEFVSRKSDIDDILMLSIEEQSSKLGIPLEQIEKGDVVRIDFKLSKEIKVEMPSGNEWGANEEWLPGGVLPEGNLEAIIKTEGLKENVHYTVKHLKK